MILSLKKGCQGLGSSRRRYNTASLFICHCVPSKKSTESMVRKDCGTLTCAQLLCKEVNKIRSLASLSNTHCTVRLHKVQGPSYTSMGALGIIEQSIDGFLAVRLLGRALRCKCLRVDPAYFLRSCSRCRCAGPAD